MSKEENHWDIFDDQYKQFVKDPENFKYFRRNGMSNMLETGLPSQERKGLIASKSLYQETYNKAEEEDIKERMQELINYFGRKVLYHLEPSIGVGSPRYASYEFNYKPNPGINNNLTLTQTRRLNFDDLYHVYAFNQIDRTIKQFFNNDVWEDIGLKPINILEIGGGYGNLAYKMIRNYPNSKYVIVDLPEILDIQEYYLNECVRNFEEYQDGLNVPEIYNTKRNIIRFDPLKYTNDLFEDDIENCNVLLVSSEDYEKLQLDFDFDLIINMRSLGEMPKKIMEKYIKWIERHSHNETLLYLVNRYVFTKSVDGNKLKDYPLSDNWEVILSQPQWLQTHLHELMLLRNENSKVPLSFFIKTFPLRTPPPGPIMDKIQTQEDWLKHQKL